MIRIYHIYVIHYKYPIYYCLCLHAIPTLYCFIILVSHATGFSFNGTDYSNHSTVLRTDIGEGPDALLCTTDYIYCCSEGHFTIGRFYFPNNTQVPAQQNVGSSGYYKNSDYRVISLNRQSENGVLTGQFSCEIPTVNGYWYHYTISVFYINIGIINFVITECCC